MASKEGKGQLSGSKSAVSSTLTKKISEDKRLNQEAEKSKAMLNKLHSKPGTKSIAVSHPEQILKFHQGCAPVNMTQRKEELILHQACAPVDMTQLREELFMHQACEPADMIEPKE